MNDDMWTICQKWERAGFESGFRWGVGCVVAFAVVIGFGAWVAK